MLRSLGRAVARLVVPLALAGCAINSQGLRRGEETSVDAAVDAALEVSRDSEAPMDGADTRPRPDANVETDSSTTDVAMPPLGPLPVLLGTAGGYAILAKAAISTVPSSVVTGDLALSPAAAASITGFSLKADTAVKWTSTQVIGSVFAADGASPTPDALTTAILNMETAYTDAAGRLAPTSLDRGGGALGGLNFAPGLHRWSTAVTIASNMTLAGGADDVWIFQVNGALTMSATAKMLLRDGARARNIFWQVAGAVTLEATSHAEGIILSSTAITLASGASINGRLLAQTAININASVVSAPE